jgi:hypothetical protein
LFVALAAACGASGSAGSGDEQGGPAGKARRLAVKVQCGEANKQALLERYVAPDSGLAWLNDPALDEALGSRDYPSCEFAVTGGTPPYSVVYEFPGTAPEQFDSEEGTFPFFIPPLPPGRSSMSYTATDATGASLSGSQAFTWKWLSPGRAAVSVGEASTTPQAGSAVLVPVTFLVPTLIGAPPAAATGDGEITVEWQNGAGGSGQFSTSERNATRLVEVLYDRPGNFDFTVTVTDTRYQVSGRTTSRITVGAGGPAVTGTATPTPLPATATSIAATAIALGTRTPTPRPGTPTPSPTPTPTPEPGFEDVFSTPSGQPKAALRWALADTLINPSGSQTQWQNQRPLGTTGLMSSVDEFLTSLSASEIKYSVRSFLRGPNQDIGIITTTYTATLETPPGDLAGGSKGTVAVAGNLSYEVVEPNARPTGAETVRISAPGSKTVEIPLNTNTPSGSAIFEFTVPSNVPQTGEFRVTVQFQGCPACNVTWVYRPVR